MKNIITILCLFAFAGCAFAEGYYLPAYTPNELGTKPAQKVEKQVSNTEQNIEETQTETTNKTEVKRVKRRGGGQASSNSYYHFGATGNKGKF